jgi:hypothetical protein
VSLSGLPRFEAAVVSVANILRKITHSAVQMSSKKDNKPDRVFEVVTTSGAPEDGFGGTLRPRCLFCVAIV